MFDAVLFSHTNIRIALVSSPKYTINGFSLPRHPLCSSFEGIYPRMVTSRRSIFVNEKIVASRLVQIGGKGSFLNGYFISAFIFHITICLYKVF